MKKSIWFILLLVCIFSLSACDTNNTPPAETTTVEGSMTEEYIMIVDDTTTAEETITVEETTTVDEITAVKETTAVEETAAVEETKAVSDTQCEHTYGEWTVTKEPTCTEDGIKECICSKCSEKQTQAVLAFGHTEVFDSAVAATCTADGLTEGKHCSVCNEVLVKQDIVPTKGHIEVIDELVPATPDKEGLTEGKHCEICGTILVPQQIIPKPSHIIKFDTTDINFEFVDTVKTHIAYPLSCDYQISNYNYCAPNSCIYIDTNFETPEEHMINFKLTVKVKCITGHRYCVIGYKISDSNGNEIRKSTIMSSAGQTSSYSKGNYYTLTEYISLPAIAGTYTITFT